MVEKLLLTRAVVFLAFLSTSDVTAASRSKSIPTNAKYFNTKSRYEDVNPYLQENILAINSSAVKPPAPACIPVHLTAIIRHGTRFPTSGNIKKIGKLHELVSSEASGDLSFLPELKAWRMWYTEEMAGQLVAKGRADHRHLAQRLALSFPSLLTKHSLLGGRVKFITSSVPRCVNSILAFQQGLKEFFEIEGVDLEHTANDSLMRFFETCERFIETVVNNKDAVVEATRFNEGPEMRKVQEKLADQLQIPSAQITQDITATAYFLCAYEFSILGVNSPWCKLFDEADAQVMDYSSDLQAYWKRGFGHEINSKAGCILFHDLFNRLETVVKQINSGLPVSEQVTVQVGHAETLLPLLTLLDLFEDKSPLTSTNLASQLDRAFRCSRNMPYIGNLLVALYDCPDGFRLQARVNEKPVTLSGLSDFSPLYEDVRARYHQLLQGCDQDTVCRMKK